MVKTSKIVPKKEKASSSHPAADKTPAEPRPEEFVPGMCLITSNFKADKGSLVPDRCETVSRYLCSITKKQLAQLKTDCNWDNKEVVILAPDEDITTHVEGFLSVYTYPFTLGPFDPVIIDFCRQYRITLGQGRDAVLRPLPGEEEASDPVSKPAEGKKRKRASTSKNPKPKARSTRKSRKNTIHLTLESVQRLRYEDEEEEDDRPVLVARSKKNTDVPHAAGSMAIYKASPRTEDISEKDSGRVPESQVVVAHREACSRSRAELRQYEADLQRATDERKALKLLLGQRGKEIKDLRAELAKAHQDQTDLSEQKLEMIGKLREEVDVIKAESLKWKGNMDRFAAEKEAARAQLSSAENQLQSLKEKSLVQARKTEELEARLAFELAKAEKTKVDVDAFVAVYRADAEAAQSHAREVAETARTRAHWIAEFAKCQSRRETLKEIHTRGFDLTEEITKAKELEADAGALASDDDDDDDDDDDSDDNDEDGSKNGSQSGEDPDGEKTAPVDN
ncbi:uncharacterized protein [Nicotiana tomentosiformis]|uniref:uncharacterized protein n=1 Tax=Nicotiana tomentosiformis TaxID=4098 RepID=UPI00388CAF78